MLVVAVVLRHQLNKIIGCFPALKVCTLPSGTIKASPQKEGFQFGSSSGPMGPISEEHGHTLVCVIPYRCSFYAVMSIKLISPGHV